MSAPELLKVALLPALFALCLYYTTTTYIIPFYRSNSARYAQYAQYLPVNINMHTHGGGGGGGTMADLSARTSSFRERLGDMLIAFVLPARRRGQTGLDENESELSLSDDEDEGDVAREGSEGGAEDEEVGRGDDRGLEAGRGPGVGVRTESFTGSGSGSGPGPRSGISPRGTTVVSEQVGRIMVGFQEIGVLTASRREEMAREMRGMEAAVGSVRRM